MKKTKRQQALESQLSPGLKEWYRILKGIVAAGNCLADDGEAIAQIDNVELETDTKGALKGLVFHLDWAHK